MNKAFVREPDEPDDAHCPHCGSIGQAVGEATLHRHLPPELINEVSHIAFFCISPRCGVGYFDFHGRFVLAEKVKNLIYPKDEDAPVCACTGLSAADVIADAMAGNPARVRELISRCRAHPEACSARTANERTCEEQIQKLYLATLKSRQQ